MNHQNYLLWRSERKMLVSKFILEKIIKKLLVYFSFINSIIYNKKYFSKDKWQWISHVFLCFIYIIMFAWFFNLALSTGFKLTFYFIILVPIILFWLSLSVLIKEFKYVPIKNISDFLFIDNTSLFNNLCVALIISFIPYWLNFSYLNFDSLGAYFIFLITLYFLLTFLFIFLNKKVLNILNCILSIPIVVFLLLYSIGLLLKPFYSKHILIKKLTKVEFVKWFDILPNWNVENEYYTIIPN